MVKVGIIGATGYVGAELVRILLRHPNVEKILLSSVSYEGKYMHDVYPNLRDQLEPKCESLLHNADYLMEHSDVIFTALPHGLAENYAFEAKKKGQKLIDLSADFRFGDDEETFVKWYKNPWKQRDMHLESVYGLPELNREKIKSASIIGNPGCYVTASTLGLAPALSNAVVKTDYIIADCKSGITGAGREPSQTNNFSEAGESFTAYAVGAHRHQPEIARNLSEIAGKDVQVIFTPHLVPMSRGILATLYAPLTEEFITNTSIEEREEKIRALYVECYKDEPFVRVLPKGSVPKTKNVRTTNICDMSIHLVNEGTMLQVISVIDNMVKGASGQAVQNMNLMYGFEETAGLDFVPMAF